jgi:outer membrane protein assembly factor BamB
MGGMGGRQRVQARGRRLLTVAVAMAVVSVSGCNAWEQFGFGAENTRHNPDETALTLDDVATLTELWSHPTDEATTQAIVSDDRVFVTANPWTLPPQPGALRAFDAAGGDELWSTALPVAADNDFFPPAALSAGELRLGTGTTFSRYDPATGALLGQVATGQPVRSPVVTGSGVMAMLMLAPGSQSPVLHVRDPQTSALRFRAPIPASPAGFSANPSVSIGGGKVIVLSGRRMYAFAVAGCGQTTCTPLWSAGQSGSTLNPPVVTGNTVLLGTTGWVGAYRADTGEALWRGAVPNAPVFLATAGGKVYAASVLGNLQVFDLDGCGELTCQPEWFATDEWFGAPTIANGVLYVGADDALLAFDAEGCGAGVDHCTEIARIPVDGDPMSVSVAGGQAFATTIQPSRVVAFGLAE